MNVESTGQYVHGNIASIDAAYRLIIMMMITDYIHDNHDDCDEQHDYV